MTKEDIINMVQETIITCPNENPFDFHLNTLEQIERFAALVADAEREACARLCEELDAMAWADFGEYASGYADEIRKRGKS